MSLIGEVQNQINDLRRELASLRLLVEGTTNDKKSESQKLSETSRQTAAKKAAAPAKKDEPDVDF